jgi:transposase
MAKVKTSVHFKNYNPSELLLLPTNLGDMIGEDDLVRVVSEMVDRWDISGLINQYSGAGTSSYHPRMLLKVLLYAYSCKLFTGRKIARALRTDIHFMWISAHNRPNFRTINNFRSGRAKETIESLFTEMLKCLLEDKYVTMENYFCDGSTFLSNGNPNKIIWKTTAKRYKLIAEEKCIELFKQIDELNAAEDKLYGNHDLEETGDQSHESKEDKNAERTKKFNALIEKSTDAKRKKHAIRLKKELQEQEEKISKYNKQITTAGERSGFNTTDTDATGMRMKDGRLMAGYNILAGCEKQMIINCSVHQNTNDATCFKDHVEQLEELSPVMPKNVVADSIYGTEENYELLENKEINNYLKYPSLHKEEKTRYKPEPFSNPCFNFNALDDTYICPNEKVLRFTGQQKSEKKKSGHQSTIKIYKCDNCSGCPFYRECCGPDDHTNRELRINQKLDLYKKQAAENLHSPIGWWLRKQRNVEVESCFGDIKQNMGIRRCNLRGIQKVKADFCLISMAHNLRKIHLLQVNVA